MDKISIVVPVYKVEKYLERCVNSILSQTYTNIEVILVDDGSPDKCPEMCEQLEQKDAAECIRRLIAQLPTLQQTIIRMKDIEGYELAEIAEITATPVENVRVNLSRARKKIREQFLQLNKQEKWT